MYDTPNKLEERIEIYKQYLDQSKKPPTIAGLAYFTGIDRQTIYNYAKKDEFFDTIKKFRDWIIMTYEEEAIQNGGSGIIFLLKNYGYTDKKEIETTGEQQLNVVFNIPRAKD